MTDSERAVSRPERQGEPAADAGTASTRAAGRTTVPPRGTAPARPAPPSGKVRMSSAQRREQLIAIGRQLFAEKGLDATSVEEVAARAKVSKPVVYEHFGGKEGLYAVVVDREVRALLDRITAALTAGHPRELLEQAALALLDYIEQETNGFRVLVRESPVGSSSGNFVSVLNDVAHQVEHILGSEFKSRGYDPKLAELYSQALVGMVALTGRWWLEVRKPRKETVAAHLVNLAWNGLSHLEAKPSLLTVRPR
ncbi:TetR/AcrR family transcriptional regulator [Luedemannella helvata]|uniref:TetR/AcrR family transcriptional regulator n=2 Tax=Luedemannella helvata TaxID=349315 RepID=A0ABN2JPV1_9ACTN